MMGKMAAQVAIAFCLLFISLWVCRLEDAQRSCIFFRCSMQQSCCFLSFLHRKGGSCRWRFRKYKTVQGSVSNLVKLLGWSTTVALSLGGVIHSQYGETSSDSAGAPELWEISKQPAQAGNMRWGIGLAEQQHDIRQGNLMQQIRIETVDSKDACSGTPKVSSNWDKSDGIVAWGDSHDKFKQKRDKKYGCGEPPNMPIF